MKRLLVCLGVIFVLAGCGKKEPSAGQKCLDGDSDACFEVSRKAREAGDTATSFEASMRGLKTMDQSKIRRY